MIRTQIQIEEEQMEWLRSKAREKGVSLSQLIRESLEHFRELDRRLPEEKKRRALVASGRFSSGKTDISERHDDYLADPHGEEDSHGR